MSSPVTTSLPSDSTLCLLDRARVVVTQLGDYNPAQQKEGAGKSVGDRDRHVKGNRLSNCIVSSLWLDINWN